MKVRYSADKKHAYFNSEIFTRDEKTGYYLTTRNHKRAGRRLHRAVWEYYNGNISKGYHIHHIDGDKNNNDISNLRIMSAREHAIQHGKELTEEQREWKRNNVIKNAVPKASEWHKTEEASRMHREMAKKQWENKKPQKYVCDYCGKEYESLNNYGEEGNRFCSNACKSAWRRKSGIDNEIRVCEVCGREFSVNKYKKTSICSRHCAMVKRHREANGRRL